MQDLDIADLIWTLLAVLPPAILAITMHEAAHGWVAKKMGDSTAYDLGRVTLNPIPHISPVGTIVVPLGVYLVTLSQGMPALFGWAKPVPVDFRNFRNLRQGMILVALAGPASNFLMATIWSFFVYAQIYLLPVEGRVGQWIFEMREVGILINVILGLFNLVPIPPLDGSRVLAGLLPPRGAAILAKIEPFGIFIVIGLVLVLWYLQLLGPLVESPLGAVSRFFHALPGII
jgi:Zn-dependent protease